MQLGTLFLRYLPGRLSLIQEFSPDDMIFGCEKDTVMIVAGPVRPSIGLHL